MHNYHDAHLTFPPGNWDFVGRYLSELLPAPPCSRGVTWVHMILPYIEQTALYNSNATEIDNCRHARDFSLRNTVLPSFSCPSDPATPKVGSRHSFQGNYVMCAAGTTSFGPWGNLMSTRLNGMFYQISRTRIRAVIDGTSNTLMGSELVLTPDQDTTLDGRGMYYMGHQYGHLFVSWYPPNTSVPDTAEDLCITTRFAPCFVDRTGDMATFARSHHVVGAHTLLVDGSVRFVSANIHRGTFQALGTRAGGEVIGEF